MSVDVPDVRYARSGDVAIAYQVVGDGPPDLVFLPFLSSPWWLWRYPRFEPFATRLAESCRLVLVNTRGMGLSDRPRGLTIEARMDDILAVLDELAIKRCTLLGIAESAATCILFAASYPERVERLIVYLPAARGIASEDAWTSSIVAAAPTARAAALPHSSAESSVRTARTRFDGA